MSLESQVMATPCARPTSTSITFLPKKGASIAISSGCVYRLIQWFVQNDFSFDNDCRIWTIVTHLTAKFHFFIDNFINPKPIIVVPGSIPNMMRSFDKRFV
jgi:hypothetical protein